MNPLRSRAAAVGAALLLVLGATLALGGRAAVHATNDTAFCVSCHEMRDHNYAEYRQTVHARNRTGVVAGCADCHVPHETPDLLWRKVGAARDLWSHWTGRVASDADFEAHRLELARKVWQRMKDTDSRECRNCHDVGAMDAALQGATARKQHQRMATAGRTCIDCHYGIAHLEPVGGDPSDLDTAAAR